MSIGPFAISLPKRGDRQRTPEKASLRRFPLVSSAILVTAVSPKARPKSSETKATSGTKAASASEPSQAPSASTLKEQEVTGAEEETATESAAIKVDLPYSPRPGPPRWQGYLFGSMAPMMAVVICHPLDVVRTRMQLQGQAGAAVVYKSALDCIVKTVTKEGALGLEKGLSTALFREASMNFFRIGMFEPILNCIHNPKEGPAPVWKRMVAGALSGSIGAISANPFDMLKTRMQAAGSAAGAGFAYKNVGEGLVSIAKTSGVRSLWKGTSIGMARSAIGTSVNLTVYSLLRETAVEKGWLKDGMLLDVICSAVSGLTSTAILNPIDVVRSRLYNQPFSPDGTGLLYSSATDCAIKLMQNEGLNGFFKGMLTGFMARGPQVVLSFVFLEQLRRASKKFMSTMQRSRRLKEVFNFFDLDQSGSIDKSELLRAYMMAFPRKRCVNDTLYEEMLQEKVDELLRKADADHSGSLDFEEFHSVSAELSEIMKKYEERQLFQSLDLDGDGRISREELLLALKAIAPPGKQQLSLERYERVLQYDVDKMMKAADPDDTGYITIDDIHRIMDSHQDVKDKLGMMAWMRSAGVFVS